MAKTANQEVYYTDVYDNFKGVVGNRPISRAHVSALERSIKKRNLLSKNPILVTSDMKIIDGQHRLEAAKKLKVNIYYMIVDGGSLPDIQMLNSVMKSWNGYDYMYSYCELGSEDYKLLRRVVETHGITISNAITIYSGFNNQGQRWMEFKQGNFKVKNKEAADIFTQKYLLFKSLVAKRIFNDREFLYALRQLQESMDIQAFIDQMTEQATPIEYQATTKDYLREFEKVLNYRKRGEYVRLF